MQVNNFKLHKIRDQAGRKAMAQETLNQYKINSKNIKAPTIMLQVRLPKEIGEYISAVYGHRSKSKYLRNLVLKDLNEESGDQKGFF